MTPLVASASAPLGLRVLMSVISPASIVSQPRIGPSSVRIWPPSATVSFGALVLGAVPMTGVVVPPSAWRTTEAGVPAR